MMIYTCTNRRWLSRCSLLVALLLLPLASLRAGESFAEFASNAQPPQESKAGEYQSLALQRIPTPEDRALLKQYGIILHDYLGQEGEKVLYWAYVPQGALAKFSQKKGAEGELLYTTPRTRGAKTMTLSPIAREWRSKASIALLSGKAPEWAQGANGWKVDLLYHKGVEEQAVLSFLKTQGCTEIESTPLLNHVRMEMPSASLEQIAKESWVRRIDFVAAPEQLENESSAATVRARELQSALPGKFGLTGKGVRLGIFDANVEPHKDLTGRLTVHESNSANDHGQHVSGTMAGAGILDPLAKGMAPEAQVHSWNFTGSTQLKMIQGYMNNGIRLTQNSYGAPVSSYCSDLSKLTYGIGESLIDELSLILPNFVHVYSAGNYQRDCAGKAGDLGGFGTVTRNPKNVITVAALNHDESMSDYSSWGPLSDGRLAPLISSVGTDIYSTIYNNKYGVKPGTSMAAPAISGTVALLQQLYMENNGGDHPPFILIKSALLNTARDKGNVGPDFKFGYGVADGAKAAKLLKEGRYNLGKIAHEEEETFTITVPQGAKELRVMLVWHDLQGTGTAGDLIDDLDLTVVSQGGSVSYPWLLDPSNPNAPAKTGVDRLNNQEQVVIANPVAGDYTITVRGYKVASTNVDFAVTHDVVMPELTLIYPAGGEIIDPAVPFVARWNSTHSGPATLFLSTDNGVSYSEFAKVSDASEGMAIVSLPEEVEFTGKALMRIATGSTFDLSDAPFTIAPRPRGVSFAMDGCSANGTMSWEKVEGATGYEVLRYDDATKSMVSFKKLDGADAITCSLDGLDPSTEQVFVAVRTLVDGGVSHYTTAKSPAYSLPIEVGTPAKELPILIPLSEGYMPYVKVSKGDNVRIDYVDLGEYGNFVRFQGYIDTEEEFNFTGGDLFADNPDFVSSVEFCIDASQISDKFLLQTTSLSIPAVTGAENRTLHRVVLVDNTNTEHVLTDLNGQKITFKSGSRLYDLSEYRGQKITLRHQALVVAGREVGGKRSFDQVLIGASALLPVKKDIAITSLTLPKDATTLTAAESLEFNVRNNWEAEITDARARVEINGIVVKSNIQIPALKPYAVTKVTVDGLNLSMPDTEYTVLVVLEYAEDVNTDNNSRSGIVRNLGDYYLIPDAPTSYPYNAVRKTVSADALRFTDNGARLNNYRGGVNGAVIFEPTSTDGRVKITFESVELAPNDELIIRNGEKSSSRILYKFTGTTTEPVTVISTFKPASSYSSEKAGTLYVELSCGGVKSAAGWVATVVETTDAEERGVSNNIYVTPDVSVSSTDHTQEPATVKITFTNTTAESIDNVEVAYRVNDGDWVRETMPTATAGLNSYSFEKKADLTLWPRIYTLEARVIADDPVDDDNASSKRDIYSDRYPITRVDNGYLDPYFISKVAAGDVENTTDASKAKSMYPQYFRGVVFTLYKDVSNALRVTVGDPKEKSGKLYAWVDWNNNYKFEEGEETLVAVEVPKGGGEVELPIAIPQAVASGEYVIRLISLTGTDPADVNKTNYGAASGEVEDYTLEVVAEYPTAKDLEVVSVTHTGTFTEADKFTVTLRNNGSARIEAPRYSIALNGAAAQEYELTEAVAPFAELTFETEATFDLRATGRYEVVVKALLADDEVAENDELTVEIFNRNITPGAESYALAFDGVDDRITVEGINDKLETFTYEAWVKLDSYGGYGNGQPGFGRIFDGKGLTLFTNGHPSHTIYPVGVMVVGVGSKNFYTEANTIPLGEWMHVTATYAQGDDAPKFYLNGEELSLTAVNAEPIQAFPGAEVPLLIGNSAGFDRQFHGEMDGLRVWNSVRTQQQIKDDMYKILTDDPSLKLQLNFNEGLYANKTASSVGSLVGVLENMAIDEEQGAWREEPRPNLSSITIANTVLPWSFADGVWSNELNDPIGHLPFEFTIDMPGGKGYHDGYLLAGATITGDFSSPFAVKLTAPWIGDVIREREVSIVLKQELSRECDLRTLNFGDPVNRELTTIPSPEIEFTVDAGTALSAVSTAFTHSTGATLWANGVEVTSPVVLDLTQPVVLKVLAANGRASQEYFVRVRVQDMIEWTPASTTLTYGDVVTLDARSIANAPLKFETEPEGVVDVRDGKIMAVGVGSVTITATQPGTNSVAPASPVSHSFTVGKKALTITADDKTVEYLDPIPELTMSFDGFVLGEDESVIDELPAISTVAERGSLAGDYEITLAGGSDDHYELSLQNGTLTITHVDAYTVTFTLTYQGGPVVGAVIEINDQQVTTDSEGVGSLLLKAGEYPWTCDVDGREPASGTVEVIDGDVPVEVTIIDRLPRFTLTYKSEPEGKIEGEATQEVRQGDDGATVTAMPSYGYEFDKWSDGKTDAQRQDTDVQADLTVTASYKKVVYKLTYIVGENGELVSGELEQNVPFMEDGTPVEVKAKPGYLFARWSDGVTDNPRTDLKVTMDMTVTAEYVKVYTLPYTQNFDASTLPEGWSVAGISNTNHIWTFKPKSGYWSSSQLTGGDGNAAIFDAYSYGYKSDYNADLISPLFDISTYSEVTMEFIHNLHKSYGVSGTLSYSTDMGKTWAVVETVTDAQNPTTFSKSFEDLAGKPMVQFKWNYTGGGFSYWLFDNLKIEGYVVASDYEVIYRAGDNGTITGAVDGEPQTIAHGENGPTVTAVADPGYAFYQWSDGVTDNPRTDKVTKTIDVTAEFGKDCSIPITEFPYIQDFDTQSLDCWLTPANASDNSWSIGKSAGLGLTENCAYVNSMAFASGTEQTVQLISPVFDLSAQSSVYITFASSFFTLGSAKAKLYYSDNGGSTWTELKGLTSSYNVELISVALPTITSTVQFKWEFTSDMDFGWGIDDIMLTNTELHKLSYDVQWFKDAGGNYFSNGTIDGKAYQLVEKGSNGEAVTAVPNQGYKFVKWSDDVIDNPRTDLNVEGNVDVYAIFEEDTSVPTMYTVTFNTNGGSLLDDVEVAENETLGRPADPIRDGFNFLGWFTDAELTQEYDFATPVTGDFTLYAKWEEIPGGATTYTVTFNTNGGSLLDDVEIAENETLGRPADPIRDGFNFLGWFTDAELTQEYDFATPVTGDFTLYAKWEEAQTATYTVTFETNGGSKVKPQQVVAGGKVAKPADPTKQGYTFDGWYADKGLKTKYDFGKEVTADITLYAKWQQATPVESIALQGVKLYPTPASTFLTVEGVSQVDALKVYSLNGSLLRTVEPGGAEAVSLDVSNLPEGTYLLVAEHGGERKVLRFVIAR